MANVQRWEAEALGRLAELVDQAVSWMKASRGVRPAGAVGYQARELLRAADNDTKAVRAALYSAAVELDEAWARTLTERVSSPEDRELVARLLRAAYNRARAARRQGARLRAAAARGDEGRGGGLGAVAAGPSDVLAEIPAQLEALLGSIYEALSPTERQILTMRAARHTQQEIAAALGCHHATVSRVLSRVETAFNRMLDDR